jgi:hypothetical protein
MTKTRQVILTMAMTICFGLPYADEVIQVDVSPILNTRSVTTYSNNKFYTWIFGIDGNGGGDGYLTMAASLAKGNVNPKALPDSGKFAATSRLPAVVLNYNNADSTHNQTHYVQGVGEFTFTVPSGNYSKMFIFLTSSEGSSALQITLTYADATTEVKTFTCPDYWNDIPTTDPNFCYLAHDLAKWGPQNNMTEANHHNIDALDVHPNAAKVLASVRVQKTAAAGYLVFWGATGIATGTPVARPAFASVKRGGTFDATMAITSGKSIRLVNLPANARVNVFSADGRNVTMAVLVNNEKLARGIYMIELRSGTESKRMRVAVTR